MAAGAPYYGNWYRGGWGGNGFWAGFGTGALTSFGMGTLGSVLGYGARLWRFGGYGYPAYAGYGVYDYFPTWGASNYAGWGLGSMANNWLYSGYTNPYYATVVAAQPAQTTVVYDYSQPINVTASAPNPATVSSSEQVFSAARDAFKAGDFQRALDLTDQVLKDEPNVPVVHEFRALCLFALKRYDEAAAVDYAVLSAGPGWNWSTLVGLYPDVDTYTNQLRALEASVKSNPSSPAMQFLLAYHYLVQGHQDAAASQFQKVAQLQPGDQLSASFVKAAEEGIGTAGRATGTGQCRSRRTACGEPCGACSAARCSPVTAPRGAASAARDASASSGYPGWNLEVSAFAGPFDRADTSGRRPVLLGSGQQGPEADADRSGRLQGQHPRVVAAGWPAPCWQDHRRGRHQVRIHTHRRPEGTRDHLYQVVTDLGGRRRALVFGRIEVPQAPPSARFLDCHSQAISSIDRSRG